MQTRKKKMDEDGGDVYDIRSLRANTSNHRYSGDTVNKQTNK